MEQIDVSEFNAACLRLLDKVRQTGEPIEILKNGEPLAIVQAASPRSRKGAFGALKSTLRSPVGDLIEPMDGIEWETIQK